MTRFATLALAAGIVAGAMVTGGKASAADPSVSYVEDPGLCGQSWVLRAITHRFRHQVKNVPNLPDVSIVDFSRIHERRYIPFSDDRVPFADNEPIARRYCGATVALSDGYYRDIWYLIEEGQGFAGVGDNVEFCVSGFDRWYVYNGRCRVLR
jgi:capsid protein